MRELRDYQLAGLDALRQTARQGVKRIVLQLPTGGGKTLCSASIAKSALAKGKRMAFVIPRVVLVDQTVEEYWKEGIRDEIGVIQSDHQLTNWAAPIQICSIDSVRARGVFPDANVVIFDEGHILTKAHLKWMDERPDAIFIALTATPWSKGMGRHFETLLVMETTRGLIDKKWLVPFRVFAPTHPDLKGIKTKRTSEGELDYQERGASEAMQKGNLTADIVDSWIKLWNRDKTFCFAVDCAHAKAIQERFQQAGVTCGYQDARTPAHERALIKRSFHDGSMRVVASVGTLLLGTDWKVDCISDCAPTKSEIRHVQKIGRGLRTADGKECLTILDHASNSTNLGFVDEIHHDHLDMGVKAEVEKKPPLPKECPKCTALRRPGISKCPNCGFEPGQRVSGIREQEGDLFEIMRGSLPNKKKAKRPEATMAEKAVFLAELKAYAIQKGRKNGWAAHSFKEKYKVWPDHSIKDCAPARYPSAATAMWCQSRAIAWAKSKKRDEAHA